MRKRSKPRSEPRIERPSTSRSCRGCSPRRRRKPRCQRLGVGGFSWLLSTLKSQRFYPPISDGDRRVGVPDPYGFEFDNCADAVAAYRERLPKMIEVAKAIAMAKLEIEGSYNESRHDGFFEDFGANGLDPGDVARFPDYLIWRASPRREAADNELILRALAAGLPAKVLVQTDDLLEPSPLGDGALLFGLRGKQLVSTAIGLGTTPRPAIDELQPVPVPRPDFCRDGLCGTGAVQRLFRRRRKRHRASALSDGRGGDGGAGVSGLELRSRGRAGLGVAVLASGQSAAGSRLASPKPRLRRTRRISANAKTSPSRWSISRPAIGALARHFAKVARAKWNENMVPVSEFAASEPDGASTKAPCLLAVDRKTSCRS